MGYILILLAPLLHALEQVLVYKPGLARWGWMAFETRFSALDGAHVARWLMVAAYVCYPHEVLSWGILGGVIVVLWHWFAYNVVYHVLFTKKPDRTFFQCLPGWKLLSEI